MGSRIVAGTVLAVVLLLVPLSGCVEIPAGQPEAINSVVEDLDIATLGEVVCDYSTRPKSWLDADPYSKSLAIEGAQHLDQIVARLEALGFQPPRHPDDDHVSMSGPDEVFAAIRVTGAKDAGEVLQYGNDYECRVPDSGLTGVTLSKY